MKSVFILEDNNKVLKQLSVMMKDNNWDVFAFNKAEDAFSNFREYVESHKKGPDLLLVDLFMPGFPWRRIAAMVFEELAWLLPLYKPVSQLTKQKEWGGLIFLREVKNYIERMNNNLSDHDIKMSKVIVIAYSIFPRLLEGQTTKYLRDLALEIKLELIEEIGVEESNIIPKPAMDEIVLKANKIFSQET